MSRLVVAFVLFASLTCAAQTHSVRYKGNDLAHVCKKGELPSAASAGEIDDLNLCMGYIAGVADSMSEVICISPQVELGQLVKVTVKWMNNNPEILHHDAAVLVYSALAEAFPCPADKSQK